MSSLRPPRLAARIIEWVVPRTDRGQAILGDLEEEFAVRARTGVGKARRWYWREALGIAVRYLRAGREGHDHSARAVMPVGDRGFWEVFVDGLAMNVKYSIRRLLRSPFFTLVAVLSLALGIGANTAMFSLVNAVMIRDLPFTDPESLVDLYEETEDFSHGTLSYPDYVDLTEATGDIFDAVGGMQLTIAQGETDVGVEPLLAEAVTGNYFGLLGVSAARGRMISPEDDVARGAHPVVLLAHSYWTARYGSDPDIVGQEVRMSGRPYTVIGVVPEAYAGSLRGLEPSIFVPISMVDDLQGSSVNSQEARGNQSFFGRARLRPDATVDQARTTADRLTTELRELYPQSWGPDKRFVLEPTADVIMNPMIDRFIVPAASMIMGVVGMVLLIACANLASFLLARAADRRKEIAVRLAMGARRRTLIGQLLTETVLLSALGGAVGIAVAVQALNALATADLPLPIPITLDLSLDGTVLTFSILVSIAAGVLFGLAPALQSTNPDVAPTLRDESAGGGRAKGAALRNLLVVGQVAVSVILLVGAGLFLRSLDASRNIDPGFGDGPTGIVELTLPADRYSDEEVLVYISTLVEGLEGRPEVDAVGVIDNLHMNPLNTQFVRVKVDGVEPPAGRDFFSVDFADIDDGLLGTLGIPLVAGRDFEEADRADTDPVILVNEEFVRRYLPNGSPEGRTVVINDEPHSVVGVTADHKVRQLGEPQRPFVYLNVRQSPSNFFFVVARTTGDSERLAMEMMTAARDLDPNVMITKTLTMRRHLAGMLLGREMGAMVVGGFALLALLLASIGLYGVVSYSVARRAKEVGIRLSLGADAGSVVRMLTGSGMKLVAIGGVIGLLVSAAASQLLSKLLYGVPALDPVTFVTVPIVLGAVALLASWIPARRVTRIDPVRALRSE